MYTRCPGCHTVHPVNAALLAGGGGRYRCGKCNKVSNALENLFDAWPAAGARAPVVGQLPVLGLTLDLQAAARSLRGAGGADAGDSLAGGAAADGGPDGAAIRPRGAGLRWLVRLSWITAALALAVIVAFQVAEFQGEPLLERAPLRAALERVGLRAPPAAAPFRDLERIHVVSRELRSHPTLPGRLRLSATIVNRAAQAQPWPDLEITLLDAAGQRVMHKLFAPADYLAAGSAAGRATDSAAGAGMTPQAYLPLVLELEDPGRQAVGFELEFR